MKLLNGDLFIETLEHQWPEPERGGSAYRALICWAAIEYLSGRPLKKITEELNAKGYKLRYLTLLEILKDKSGDKWTKVVNGEEVILDFPGFK